MCYFLQLSMYKLHWYWALYLVSFPSFFKVASQKNGTSLHNEVNFVSPETPRQVLWLSVEYYIQEVLSDCFAPIQSWLSRGYLKNRIKNLTCDCLRIGVIRKTKKSSKWNTVGQKLLIMIDMNFSEVQDISVKSHLAQADFCLRDMFIMKHSQLCLSS